jgi:hypothetical protein
MFPRQQFVEVMDCIWFNMFMRQPEIVSFTFYLQTYQLNIDFGTSTSSVQRFLLVFLSIVISGSNSVIKQLQSCVEVDMRLNGPKKAIWTKAVGHSRYCFLGPFNLISTSTQDCNCFITELDVYCYMTISILDATFRLLFSYVPTKLTLKNARCHSETRT